MLHYVVRGCSDDESIDWGGRYVIDHPGNCSDVRGQEELTLLFLLNGGRKWIVKGWWCRVVAQRQ